MFEELMESAAQKDRFRVAANKLLNQCFLLRKRADEKLGEVVAQADDAIESAVESAVEGAKEGFFQSLKESINNFFRDLTP